MNSVAGASEGEGEDSEEFNDCLTVFQAAPLVWVDGQGKNHPFPLLDFDFEKQLLTEAVKDVSNVGAKIDIVFDTATTDRLGAFLVSGNSSVLHFSCHGHPDYLAIENEGAMQALSVHKLQQFIAAGNYQLKFVFVSACHSRFVGDAFLEAGVPHVICCHQDEMLKDSAAVVFSRNFYRALAYDKTLKEAFRIARQAVMVSPMVQGAEAEMKKFLLLPERPPGDPYHNVSVFQKGQRKNRRGADTDGITRAKMMLPPPPQRFIGRQSDMYQILHAMKNKARLIRLVGPAKVGKCSLAKALCHYLEERKQAFHVETVCWFPPFFPPSPNESVLETALRQVSDALWKDDDSTYSRALGNLVGVLYERLLFLTIDGRSLTHALSKFVRDLLGATLNLTVLLVCPEGKDISTDGSCIEVQVDVQPLNVKSTVLLFGDICPFVSQRRSSSVQNPNDLVDLLVPTGTGPMTKKSSDVYQRLGAGIPGGVQTAATTMTREEYDDLIRTGKRPVFNAVFETRCELEVAISKLSAELAASVAELDFLRAQDCKDKLEELKQQRENHMSLTKLKETERRLVSDLNNAIASQSFLKAHETNNQLVEVRSRIAREEEAGPCNYSDDAEDEEKLITGDAQSVDPDSDASGSETSALEKIQQLMETDHHGADVDIHPQSPGWRTLDKVFCRDWEDKTMGATTDATRAILLGVAKDTKSKASLLVVRHVDTGTLVSGKVSSRYFMQQPACWAIALNPREFRTVSEAVVKGGAGALVIHREPPPEVDPDSSWYQESSWIVDHGMVTGIRIAVKATQDDYPTVHSVKIILEGNHFRMIGSPIDETDYAEDHSGARSLEAARRNKLPDPYDVKRKPQFVIERVPVKMDYEATGDLPVLIDHHGAGATAENFASADGSMNQAFLSGKISIFNPTDDSIAIKTVFSEIKHGGTDNEYVQCTLHTKDSGPATRVGQYDGSTMVRGVPLPRASWFKGNDTGFKIPPNEKVDIVVMGTTNVLNTMPYAGRPLCFRLHHSFSEPVTVRATFVDYDGNTKSISWEFSNHPLQHRKNISCYDDLLLVPYRGDPHKKFYLKGGHLSNGYYGVGGEYQCDLWLHADNPNTLERVYLVVTSAKKKGDRWYIRASKTSDYFPMNCSATVTPSVLKRLSHDAKKTGSSEVDMTKEWCGNRDICSITALVDLDLGIVYGLRAEIKIDNGNITCSKSMYFNHLLIAENPDDIPSEGNLEAHRRFEEAVSSYIQLRETRDNERNSATTKIEELMASDKHVGDLEIDTQSPNWKTLDGVERRDWNDSPRTHVSDASRAIMVGMTKDPTNSSLLLVIRHVDTATEIAQDATAGKMHFSRQPAVWAIGLSPSEFRTVTKNVMEGGQNAQLIHREPPPIVDPNKSSPWYEESSWIVENNKVTGIRIAVKASQDMHPTVHAVKIALVGRQFRMVGNPIDESHIVEDDSGKRFVKASKVKRLPCAHVSRLKKVRFATEKAPVNTEYEAEGDLPIHLDHDTHGTTAQTMGSIGQSMDQVLQSGKMSLFNPTDKPVCIQKVYTEIRHTNTDGNFVKCSLHPSLAPNNEATRIGHHKGECMTNGILVPEVSWFKSDDTAFSIPPKSKVDVVVKATTNVPDTACYNGGPLCFRLHHSFPEPVTVRATFGDYDRKTKSISWDFSNEPLQHRSSISCYDDLLLVPSKRDPSKKFYLKGGHLSSGYYGIGYEFQCDLWLQVDSPRTLERVYLVVTSAKEKGDRWYIRASKTSEYFPLNCSAAVTPAALKRLAYDAKRSGSSEVDMTNKWCSNRDICSITALIDLDLEIVYGLRAEINLADEKITCSKSMYFDQVRVSENGDKI